MSLSSFLFLSENKLVNTLEACWVSLYKQVSSTGLKKSPEFLPSFLPPALLQQVVEKTLVIESRSSVWIPFIIHFGVQKLFCPYKDQCKNLKVIVGLTFISQEHLTWMSWFWMLCFVLGYCEPSHWNQDVASCWNQSSQQDKLPGMATEWRSMSASHLSCKKFCFPKSELPLLKHL